MFYKNKTKMGGDKICNFSYSMPNKEDDIYELSKRQTLFNNEKISRRLESIYS